MAVTMYAVQGVGNNDNSGSTQSATPKADGAAAVTDGSATVLLSGDTPDLSGVEIGDTIRIDGRTDGKNGSDIFEITAVDDTLDTVDVTPSPGADVDQVWAIGGAFATLSRLTAVASAGDHLYATGTYDEAVDGSGGAHAQGTLTSEITLEGYTATPGDGGMVTLDSNGTKANGYVLPSAGVQCWHYKNIRITRYTNQGFRNLGGSGPFKFTKCRTDNCGAAGFLTGNLAHLVDCYSHNNGGDGFFTAESAQLVRCIAQANTGHGFNIGGGATFYRCAALSNAGNGIHQTDDLTHARVVVIQCLIDGDGDDTTIGINLFDDTNPGNGFIVDSIIYDCATGVAQQSNSHGIFRTFLNNLVNGNTTPFTNFDADGSEVTSAPSFTTEGTDYTPAAGSPLIGAGFSFSDSPWLVSTGHDPQIGPLPPLQQDEAGAPPGGGGGECGPIKCIYLGVD